MRSSVAFGLDHHDIIMTGTPEGVDHFSVGDVFDIELSYKEKILIEKHWKVEK